MEFSTICFLISSSIVITALHEVHGDCEFEALKNFFMDFSSYKKLKSVTLMTDCYNFKEGKPMTMSVPAYARKLRDHVSEKINYDSITLMNATTKFGDAIVKCETMEYWHMKLAEGEIPVQGEENFETCDFIRQIYRKILHATDYTQVFKGKAECPVK